nr:MAG TPA: hypothetical protein [Caudoviricetes sp.]
MSVNIIYNVIDIKYRQVKNICTYFVTRRKEK